MRHWFRHLFGGCVRCEVEERLARICVDCGYEHDDYDWLNDPLKRPPARTVTLRSGPPS